MLQYEGGVVRLATGADSVGFRVVRRPKSSVFNHLTRFVGAARLWVRKKRGSLGQRE